MADESIRDLSADWKREPAKVVRELKSRYDQATGPRREAWKRWRKLWRNEWYRATGHGLQRYSTNYVHSNIEVLMGYYQAQPPTVSVRATSVQAHAEDIFLDGLMQHAMKVTDFENTMWRGSRHALTLGTAWLKQRFDPSIGRYGEPVCEALPAETVMADPWAPSYDNLRFLLHRVPAADPADVAARFKVSEGDIKPKADDKKQSPTVGGKSPLPVADLIEAWLWVEGKDGMEWQVAWTSGDDVLKGPVPNPFDHGRLPFVPLWDIPPEESIFGVGEAEMIEPLQDWADELDWRIRKIVKKSANRRLLVNESLAGVTAADWDDESTAAVGVSDASPDALRWVDEPTFPEALLTERDSVEKRIEKITGVGGMLGGVGAAGTTGAHRLSGVAASIEAEQAQKRVESRMVALRWSVKQASYQMLRLMVQYYKEERIIALPSGKTVHIYPDYPQALQDAWKGLSPPDLVMAKTAWRQQNKIDLVMSDVQADLYDVDVETDTAMPSSKAAKANLAQALFKLQAIDKQALLDALEWPEREEILLRMAGQQPGAPQGMPQGAPQTPPGGPQPQGPPQSGQAPPPAGLGALQGLLQGAAGAHVPPPTQPAVSMNGVG